MIDKISKISLLVSIAEHAVILTLAAVTFSIPARKYIPLVEVGLVSLQKNFTEGLSLPNTIQKLSDEDIKNIKPSNLKPVESGKSSVELNSLSGNSLLPPSEVGVTAEASLVGTLDIIGTGIAENLSLRDGKVAGFSLTGTGIVTAKPDNVYVQFSIKSESTASLRSAELDIKRKLDFITYNIGRLYSIKNESIKTWGFAPEMHEQIIRTPRSLQQRDEYGNVIQQKKYKYTITKYIIINDLGSKTIEEICDLIDKAVSYGVSAVANIPSYAGDVESSTSLGTAKAKLSAIKGASKLEISTDVKDPANELINYHFKEETLEKLIKEAKDKALVDAKDKVDKVKKILNFKENEMKITFAEKLTATNSEEGEITIRADVTAILSKPEEKTVVKTNETKKQEDKKTEEKTEEK